MPTTIKTVLHFCLLSVTITLSRDGLCLCIIVIHVTICIGISTVELYITHALFVSVNKYIEGFHLQQ